MFFLKNDLVIKKKSAHHEGLPLSIRPRIHKAPAWRVPVPKEIKSKEDFEKMLENAEEIRVVRTGDDAKVKARTGHGLFTFKTTVEEADSMVKGKKVPTVEY